MYVDCGQRRGSVDLRGLWTDRSLLTHALITTLGYVAPCITDYTLRVALAQSSLSTSLFHSTCFLSPFSPSLSSSPVSQSAS